MKRVLLTGMSGVGKSTVVTALSGLGFKAVDTDYDGWCVAPDGESGGGETRPGWIWDEERMRRLLTESPEDLVFVSGCVENQGRFYGLFTDIVLLSVPEEVALHRLSTRTNNDYGKSPDDLAQELQNRREVEPLLRRGATWEVDTTQALDDVVDEILAHVAGLRRHLLPE